MKKKFMTSGIILIIILSISCGYSVFNDFFPKASQIICPNIESVFSATVTYNDDNTFIISNSDFEKLIFNINNAKPTRKQSLNDNPTIKPYYAIEIKTFAKKYHYFVYEEGSQVYIEIPYEGIYRADYPILDVIMKYDDQK